MSLKNEFEQILNRSESWSRLAGSQFVVMLSNFVGQVAEKVKATGARYLQENFLSTAVKRASILAAAEDKGYVGRKRMPSVGIVTITNVTDQLVSLAQNTPMLSKASVQYVNTMAVEIPAGGSVDAPVSQLVLRTFQHKVTSADKYLEVLLSKEITKVTHRVDVYVVTDSGGMDLWEKRFMFRRANSRSKVYTEFYKPTDQLGIRFGNGLNGMIPPYNSTIVLHVWTTSGDTTLIDNQPLEALGRSGFLNEMLDIRTKTPIVGGAEAESDEETRSGALYLTAYDEQLAWQDDFEYFVKANLANITWVKAWGEQQQEAQEGRKDFDWINVIFLSAYSPKLSQETLQTQILDVLGNTSYLNKRYRYVPVKMKPFTIAITASLTGDKDFLTVKNSLIQEVNTRYGKDPSGTRPDVFLKKEVTQLIKDTNLLADFEIDWTHFPEAPLLEEYVYLDIANSTFNFSYQRVE